jgi:hypothetical protein
MGVKGLAMTTVWLQRPVRPGHVNVIAALEVVANRLADQLRSASYREHVQLIGTDDGRKMADALWLPL